MTKPAEILQKSVNRYAPVAAILVAVVIAVLSLIPAEEVPGTGVSDKLDHFLAYGVLSFLAVSSVKRRRILPLACLLVLYGCALELLQEAMPFGREGSWLDAVANAGGVVLGLAAMAIMVKWSPLPLKFGK